MAHADYSNYKGDETKEETLQSVVDSYEALSSDTQNWVANLANCSSLIWHAYHSLNIPVNWAGFYVINPEKQNELILGPFQGKVACQTIEFGKGVCGNAASSKNTQLVKNVNEYPGHIACDGDTQSEIVVPIVYENKVVGVLDIDCLDLNGFDKVDQKYLERLVEMISSSCKW
ncbi:hypothetical protein PGUG_03427 [Meyerozyma guilliermondii ATCC 6260]|uniref:GAF domain-containing protein n=1 Tax=Meyerozyma guilliermondii (strain ATCC 6260 / CBS 566 / DSM 6381 / JCM 1539 / NBRC 10279 / NRRL Y-324) TaxID=294746 RepID=A5DJH6_PICGU|nr:uncharacterized protein PGUG_03427 [Meyerozyma guilliermondii ATCC 6260]EDK39329.1 hypothetical protein PGUG_03427 [Meyerozyma guilliermondii ATCC 6260]